MFKEYIMTKIKKELPRLNKDNIYVVSFFLDSNEINDTVPSLLISCNVENENNIDPLSEERWNFAFWLQNVIGIINDEDAESIDRLKDWYQEIGIKNPGYEDLSWDVAYNGGRYIGKGPKGVFEFVNLLKEIIQELHESGYIKRVFGKSIPIIIHDLEYVWYMVDATIEANPDELINDFEDYHNQW